MDRDSFDNLDRNYQQELNGHKQTITQKWQGFYANKQYVGTPEMQAKARANDQAQMQQKINAELGGITQQLGKTHFDGKQRDEVFKELERQEEIKRKTEQIRQEFARKAQDKKRGR